MDSTSDDKLLTARIADAVSLCEKHGYPHFVGFLDERQRAVAAAQLKRVPEVKPLFWGGFADAERTLLGVFPDFYAPDVSLFPLQPLSFIYRETATLTHRDFLGTMLGCGVRREKIGDILCDEGKTVAFVCEDIAPFLIQQMVRVGGEGVTVKDSLDGAVSAEHRYKELQMTVASPRLDNVVKALTGVSRETAAANVTGGLVSLNHQLCQTVTKIVCEGDILSVRGMGRFRITALSAHTKKDRLVLIAQKYL